MVFFHAKDINGRGSDIASGGKSHSCQEVKADPYTPGIIIGKIGYRSQASCKPANSEVQSYQHNYAGNDIEGADE
jgi:hypothetical protein